MQTPHFFGYGSLVNRATHAFPKARTARLDGWRRVWRHTTFHNLAFLTAVPMPGHVIDGLVAMVPNADWAALDLREAAYLRVQTDAVVTGDAAMADCAVYSIPADLHAAPAQAHPIALSYLDVVVQGFAREFGPAGVQRFFDTTDGWDAPVLDDRAAPVYPRHQLLTDTERALVDDGLAAKGARLIPA